MRIAGFTIGKPFRRVLNVCSVVAALLFLPSQAFAFELGNIVADSFYGEPLELRVELGMDPDVDQFAEVVFELASLEEFALAGIRRPDFADQIQFESVLENGRSWLRIFTVAPVHEAFLRMLIRVDWDEGSILREYSVLIDPPANSDGQTQPPVTTPQVAEEIESTASPLSATGDELAVAESMRPDSSPFRAEDTSFVYGPVKPGVTLGQIAVQLRQTHPEFGYYETLYILVRDNQHAFIEGNMNLLREGEVLKLDNLDDVRLTYGNVAMEAFQTQRNEWLDYLVDRGQPLPTFVAADAASVGTSNELDSFGSTDEPVRVSSGLINTTVETNPGVSESMSATDATADQSEFRIGSADSTEVSSGGTNDDIRALQNRASELESSLLSSQRENSELRTQIDLLESQLASVDQVLTLEGMEPSALQEENIELRTHIGLLESQLEVVNKMILMEDVELAALQGGIGEIDDPDLLLSGLLESGDGFVDEESSVPDEEIVAPMLVIDDGNWLDFVIDLIPANGSNLAIIDLISANGSNPAILGVIGGSILVFTVLLFWRRRKVREEIEYSMLASAVDAQFTQVKLDGSLSEEESVEGGDFAGHPADDSSLLSASVGDGGEVTEAAPLDEEGAIDQSQGSGDVSADDIAAAGASASSFDAPDADLGSQGSMEKDDGEQSVADVLEPPEGIDSPLSDDTVADTVYSIEQISEISDSPDEEALESISSLLDSSIAPSGVIDSGVIDREANDNAEDGSVTGVPGEAATDTGNVSNDKVLETKSGKKDMVLDGMTLSDLLGGEDMKESGADPDEFTDDVQATLELAQVYAGLGDKDNAEQILKEVMKEGNDAQKEQATEILSKLND